MQKKEIACPCALFPHLQLNIDLFVSYLGGNVSKEILCVSKCFHQVPVISLVAYGPEIIKSTLCERA